MTHQEFVAAHREGKLAVHIDPKKAAQLVSSRMMLPLILLPVLGLAVALALTGYLITGVLLFVAALGLSLPGAQKQPEVHPPPLASKIPLLRARRRGRRS